MRKVAIQIYLSSYIFVMLADGFQYGQPVLSNLFFISSLFSLALGSFYIFQNIKIYSIYLAPLIFIFIALIASIFNQNSKFDNYTYVFYSLFCYANLSFSLILLNSKIKSNILKIFSSKIFIFSILMVLGVIVYGLFNSNLTDLIRCNEHSIRAFAKENITLFCSYFDSSKKYARYLQILYFLFINSLISINLKSKFFIDNFSKRTKKLIIFSSAVYLFLSVLSGAREALFISILLTGYIIYYLVFNIDLFKIKLNIMNFFDFIYKPILKRNLIIFVIPFSIFLSLVIYSILSNLVYLKFLFFIGDDSLLTRLNSLFPFGLFNNFDFKFIFGNGLGTYGQEARVYSEYLVLNSTENYFNITNSYLLRILDSGILKITVELGLFGLFGFLFLLFKIYSLCKFDKITSFRKLLFGVLIFSILKIHAVISDPIYVSLYAFSGALICETVNKYLEKKYKN